MKNLFVDVRPNRAYMMYGYEFTPEFMNEVVTQTAFDYPDRIDPRDIDHIITMAYAYRMAQEFKRRNLNVRFALSPSLHNNYIGWLLLVEADDTVGNIMPLIAKYFQWDRMERQNIMTIEDLYKI